MATFRRKRNRPEKLKELKYTTKPVKSRRMPGFIDIIWQVRENTRKVVNVFEFEDDAQKFADFHNKNQVWKYNNGIPKFLCIKEL
jgi:hypothetical protein